MSEIDERIATYLSALEVEGKMPTTIASYASSLADLRRVGRRLGFPDRPDEYRVEHVYAFLADLRQRGASAAYQHRRHREVRACFSWLKRLGYIEGSVFAKVPLVKWPQAIRQPFTPEEVNTLLRSQDRTVLTGCRNYALLLFLLDTGIRAGECVALELVDLDWERGRALIRHGKGDKACVVAFSASTAAAGRDYLGRYRGLGRGRLFLTRAGKAMASAHTLNVLLARLGARAGVATVYPHRFRHPFATWAIESGAREIDVQLLLGHSSLAMTQRYTRTYTSEQAIGAHANLSPVRRLAPEGGSLKASQPVFSPKQS